MSFKATAFSLVIGLTCTFFVAGCDDGVSIEPDARGLESQESPLVLADALPPEACSQGANVPEGASLVATAAGTLVADYMLQDPMMGISMAASTEYSCDCTGEGGGTCYPKLIGSDVFCVSMSCSDCSLQETSVSGFTALERATAACGLDYGEEEHQAVTVRARQIRDWQARQRIPEPQFDSEGVWATAPRGHRPVMELLDLGTSRIVYAAPEEMFDRATGELLRAAGPPNFGGDLLLQAAAGGRAKCYCSGSGSCSFTLDNVCAGTCDRTQTGDRGCVIKIKRGLFNRNAEAPSAHDTDPYLAR